MKTTKEKMFQIRNKRKYKNIIEEEDVVLTIN
jgi:hypothetical protein